MKSLSRRLPTEKYKEYIKYTNTIQAFVQVKGKLVILISKYV